MRIVADTNTVVSALLWRGSPHRLVAAIEDHPIGFFTSRALLEELAEVLARPKLAAAITARAQLIVSGDRHLTELKTHRGIRIVNAAQALDIIGGGPSRSGAS